MDECVCMYVYHRYIRIQYQLYTPICISLVYNNYCAESNYYNYIMIGYNIYDKQLMMRYHCPFTYHNSPTRYHCGI